MGMIRRLDPAQHLGTSLWKNQEHSSRWWLRVSVAWAFSEHCSYRLMVLCPQLGRKSSVALPSLTLGQCRAASRPHSGASSSSTWLSHGSREQGL